MRGGSLGPGVVWGCRPVRLTWTEKWHSGGLGERHGPGCKGVAQDCRRVGTCRQGQTGGLLDNREHSDGWGRAFWAIKCRYRRMEWRRRRGPLCGRTTPQCVPQGGCAVGCWYSRGGSCLAWCSSQGSGSAFAGADVTCGRMLVHVSVCLSSCSCRPAGAQFVNAETLQSRVRSFGAWRRYRCHTA